MSSSPSHLHQREVMVRSQESTNSATSAETREPQPTGCSLIADMVNSSYGTEPHLDKFKEHQPECKAVQFKESDKEVSISAAEQEAVSGPVVIFSDMTQDNSLQSTELALESVNLHEIDTALIDILPEVKQAKVTTMETEEQSTDIKNEPQDQPDLESPVIKLIGEMDEVENGPKSTSSPEPQTSHKDQSSPKPSHEHSLDVNGDGMIFQEIAETRMDPKDRDDYEHLEETCFNSETQLQAPEETETLELPAKKRLRRRMGMCGLGDRKRKLPFDEQHCRQGLIGRQREEGAGEGNKGVQHLYNTVLENDSTTPMDHEGTTRPGCKENEEVLKDKENNCAAVMDDERTTGLAEKENSYAVTNSMNKCIAVMNDESTTEESPTEDRDVPKKGILEENDGTVIMDDMDAEQMVLEHELNLLEEISAGVGQTPLSPTIGKNLIQDEPSVAAATNDHEMEIATCGDEPDFPGADMTNNGQDIEFNMKHDVLSQKQNLHADNKVDEDPDEIATEVEVAQEVICSSGCATVEMSEGSVIVTNEVQKIPTNLEESEMKIEEQCPPNMAATEKHDTNEPELSGSTEKGLDPLFVDILDIATIASSEIQNAKGHGENDKPIPAVSESTEPARGDTDNAEKISETIAPPAGQENHMHCLLDQNACDTSVNPSVAEQQVCNPSSTPAASELPQETDLSVPSLLYSMTDSQLHKIALSMELEDEPIPEGCDQQEDATELVRGLIGELSSLNRTVMAAHREMELLRRGKLPKAPNRRLCGPRHTEM
ncbi:hypothetical protein PHYPO_G00155470 [Pangasianodon hypophthalmus]|uniref:Uncharacterized protein n=1 Tax=Pangasianodon hypophthalmus TaxID=310915 RepID=A0A5N5JZZ2_PANHP|nr:hypothetical protein PHYPO_G00155470 [Pangasianodon hypophthalmus]